MKSIILTAMLVIVAAIAIGQTTNNSQPNIKRSGWTTTTNPVEAIEALGATNIADALVGIGFSSSTNGGGGSTDLSFTNSVLFTDSMLNAGSLTGTVSSLTVVTQTVSVQNVTNQNVFETLTVGGTNVMGEIAESTGGAALVGLWTYDDKGYYPTVGGDGSVFQQAYDYSLTYNTNYLFGNNSFVRVGRRDFLIATRWNTNVVGYPQYTYTEPGWAVWRTKNFLSVTNTAFIRTGISGLVRLWAPMLFQDTNGALFCYFSGSTTSNGTFQIYQQRALDTTYTNWTDATVVTNLTSNAIDPEMVWSGSQYVLFFKDESTKYICAATSTNPTNGFTVVKSSDWAGFGADAEAPSVTRKPNGDWIIFFDRYNDGTWMNVSTSTNLLAGWTTRALVKCPNMTNIVRHGSARYVPISEVGDLLASATSSTNAQQHLSKTIVEGPWDGIGRNVVVGSGQAGFAIYPNGFSSSPWLINGTTTLFTLWTPTGLGLRYDSSAKTFTFAGIVSSTNFTGNGRGLTNLAGSVVYTNGGSSTFTNGTITLVTNGLNGSVVVTDAAASTFTNGVVTVGLGAVSSATVTNLTVAGTMTVTNIGASGATPQNLTIKTSGSIPGDIFILGGDASYGDGGDITLQGGLAGSGGRHGVITLSSNVLINGTFTNNGSAVVSGTLTVTNLTVAGAITGGNVLTNRGTGTRALAVIGGANATATDSIALGNTATATGISSFAVSGASAGGSGAFAFGISALGRGDYTVAFYGAQAGITGNPTAATDIFCFGRGSVETNSNFVRFGGNGGAGMTLVSSNANFNGSITSSNGITMPNATWSLSTVTNGMGAGDFKLVNSNGWPVQVWISNSHPNVVINNLWP